MADLKTYLVTFDPDGDVVSTKLAEVAPEINRTVAVLATSATEARKKAEVLLGQSSK